MAERDWPQVPPHSWTLPALEPVAGERSAPVLVVLVQFAEELLGRARFAPPVLVGQFAREPFVWQPLAEEHKSSQQRALPRFCFQSSLVLFPRHNMTLDVECY